MTPDYAHADHAFDELHLPYATIRVPRCSTHYYVDRRNFCPHCQAEYLAPVAPLPIPATWRLRLSWMAFGIAIGLALGFALWGVIS